MIIAKLKGDATVYSSEGPHFLQIDIVAPGIILQYQTTTARRFIPWHMIEWVEGTSGEFEHELEQFYHLGIS